MSVLPRNIDLTEHRDFGGSNTFFFDTPIEIPIDEYRLMTPDEYDHIMWYEGIFGRNRHYMDKSKIFDTPDVKRYWDCHCARCGVELRTPWNLRGGLCKECDEIVEFDEGDMRTPRAPWKRKNENLFEPRREDIKYNLFNSR